MQKTLCLLALLAFTSLSSLSHGQTGYAATSNGNIIQFDFTNPMNISSTAPITGLRMADGVSPDAFGSLFELAYNYDNNQFYGLDGNANFYSVNVTTGVASFIANSFSPTGFDAGLAYDPFVTSLRFVSDAAENAVLNIDGTVSSGNPVFYSDSMATPSFSALGIDPAFGTPFAIDANLGILATSFDPNFEEFFSVGSLGIAVTGYGSLTVLPEDGSVFGALSVDGFTSSLYAIDTFTGAATKVGDFGMGVNAITVPEPSTSWLLLGALSFAAALRRRRAAAVSRS